MCTASLIELHGITPGYRLVFNRDELRSRAPGEEPRWREFAGTRALAPLDPDSGGTWIAANERGMTLAVTNVNPRPVPVLPHASSLKSRGSLVPTLISSDSAHAAVESISDEQLGSFAPFRLLAIDLTPRGVRLVEGIWDRVEWRVVDHSALPVCFASSGLGDERVAGRLELFRACDVRTSKDQDAFHIHRWPTRPEVSVLMSRDDARTVSITCIEVRQLTGSPDVQMAYKALTIDEVEVVGGGFEHANGIR
jgi:hypothetical protein